jgi:hypothetical protein
MFIYLSDKKVVFSGLARGRVLLGANQNCEWRPGQKNTYFSNFIFYETVFCPSFPLHFEVPRAICDKIKYTGIFEKDIWSNKRFA